MTDDPPKKLNLARFVRASAAENVARIPLAELEERFVEVEKRVGPTHAPLWEREWAAMTLRGISRELGSRDDERARELSAKIAAKRAALLEEDRREMAPLQEQIARGAYNREALFLELERRPRFEWDAFIERALDINEPPRPEKQREKEMVHYLASPFEVVLELLAELREDDVLYDLGAGLGKVTLSAAWLSPARAKGVEMDPAYARRAAELAARFGFTRAEMICADAREVDYSDGTTFYFYDPFRGAILDAVLAKIHAATAGRKIRVYSRGASTPKMDLIPWLERVRALENGLTIYLST